MAAWHENYNTVSLMATSFLSIKGQLLYSIFRIILVFCVCTRTCLHTLMLKFIFVILPMAAAPVFTLCMRRSVGAPVSLIPPPEKNPVCSDWSACFLECSELPLRVSLVEAGATAMEYIAGLCTVKNHQ